jgi:hypothetical protein
MGISNEKIGGEAVNLCTQHLIDDAISINVNTWMADYIKKWVGLRSVDSNYKELDFVIFSEYTKKIRTKTTFLLTKKLNDHIDFIWLARTWKSITIDDQSCTNEWNLMIQENIEGWHIQERITTIEENMCNPFECQSKNCKKHKSNWK